jgi:hypothetical protein
MVLMYLLFLLCHQDDNLASALFTIGTQLGLFLIRGELLLRTRVLPIILINA